MMHLYPEWNERAKSSCWWKWSGFGRFPRIRGTVTGSYLPLAAQVRHPPQLAALAAGQGAGLAQLAHDGHADGVAPGDRRPHRVDDAAEVLLEVVEGARPLLVPGDQDPDPPPVGVLQHGLDVDGGEPTAPALEGAGGAGAGDEFDFWHPDNVAPFVAWLCSDAAAQVSGKVFGVQGDTVEQRLAA